MKGSLMRGGATSESRLPHAAQSWVYDNLGSSSDAPISRRWIAVAPVSPPAFLALRTAPLLKMSATVFVTLNSTPSSLRWDFHPMR